MNLCDIAEKASKEWDYNTEGSLDASIPCQLQFTSSPKQNTSQFHSELESNGWKSVDVKPGNHNSLDKDMFYEGEIVSEEHHNRVKVLVYRGDLIRLYPLDEYIPDSKELSEIIEALSKGFNAELEHKPIER